MLEEFFVPNQVLLQIIYVEWGSFGVGQPRVCVGIWFFILDGRWDFDIYARVYGLDGVLLCVLFLLVHSFYKGV